MVLNNARSAAKSALELLYEGRCKITCKVKTKQPDGSTSFSDRVIAEDEPCRLSHDSFPQTTQIDGVNRSIAIIKLFLGSDVEVPEGSEIEVTQYGVTASYHLSGPPEIYSTHQEIALEAVKRVS